MRRLSGVVLAGAIVMLPAFSQHDARVFAQEAQKLTFDGDMSVWSFAIKGDKVADYEQVIAKLKDALNKSERPDAKQQAMGWKVMRGVKTPTGDVVYTHVIYPVVKGADYTILTLIYEVVKDPNEQRELYELYRNAISQPLGANVGTVVSDFSKP